MLARDELDRANKFRFDFLRRSFIVARASLRCLLGRYLSTPPAHLQFAYGAKGKPCVDGPSSISFNLSHSGDVATFAFTERCELGIDIEQIRPIPDMEDVARRMFCSAEVDEWLSLSESHRVPGFYTCWTRREAFIKATGEGLPGATGQLRVSLLPDTPPQLIQVPPESGQATGWCLHNLDIATGYAAAASMAGTVRSGRSPRKGRRLAIRAATLPLSASSIR